MRITSLCTLYLRPSYSLIAAAIVFAILFQQPLHAQTIHSTGPISTNTNLSQLFTAKQKTVAAVYPFQLSTEQQSQPKNVLQATTAVDYTPVLFEILQHSGWFIPIVHGDAGNFLNGLGGKPSSPLTAVEMSRLPDSQKPTVILEAGLFSHDANFLQDETGSLYFAGSSSNQYRQDRATVFLRALSAQSGKILKTIYWTGTILSQPVNNNTYRYVLMNRSKATRSDTTSILPDRLAVTEAISRAVEGLIIEGVRDGLWLASEGSAAQTRTTITAYEAEKMSLTEVEKPEIQSRKTYGIRAKIAPSLVNLCLYGGSMRYHGDYTKWDTKAAFGLSLEAYINPYIGVQLNLNNGTLSSENAFSTRLTSIETNLILRLLPYWRLTPLVYGGVGVVTRTTENPFAFKGSGYLQYQGGFGLQYSLSNTFGFRTILSYNLPSTDLLDGKKAGSHNDFYVRTTLGLVIHFGHYVSRNKLTANE